MKRCLVVALVVACGGKPAPVITTPTPDAHVTADPHRYVVKTEDGGATWKERAMPHGFETLDGGATWKVIDTMPKATNKLRIAR